MFRVMSNIVLDAMVMKPGQQLTCLHALVVFFCGGDRPVVGLVDCRAEALVAAPAPDDARAGPVEGEVPVEGHLGDGCLEALQGARLLQAEGGPQVLGGGTWGGVGGGGGGEGG